MGTQDTSFPSWRRQHVAAINKISLHRIGRIRVFQAERTEWLQSSEHSCIRKQWGERAVRMKSWKVSWKQTGESLESHTKDAGHYKKYGQLLKVKEHESEMISTFLFEAYFFVLLF